jgi:hypothetical protein
MNLNRDNFVCAASDIKEIQEQLKVSNSSSVVIDLITGEMTCKLCAEIFDSGNDGNALTSTCQACLDSCFETDEEDESPQKKQGQINIFSFSLLYLLQLCMNSMLNTHLLSPTSLPRLLIFLTHSLTHLSYSLTHTHFSLIFLTDLLIFLTLASSLTHSSSSLTD